MSAEESEVCGEITAHEGELFEILLGDAVEDAIVHKLNVFDASFVGGDDEECDVVMMSSGDGGHGKKSGDTEIVSGTGAGEAIGLGYIFLELASAFKLLGAGREGVLFRMISSISWNVQNIEILS